MQLKAKTYGSMNFNTYLVAHNQFKKFMSNRIMIVDDEEFCLSSMKVILKGLGIDTNHRVDCCITGKEALEQIVNA